MIAYVLSVLLLLAVAAVISYPLLLSRLEAYTLPDEELPEEPYTERDALLEQLSELELSFHSGKVSEEIYSAQKAKLQKQYIETIEAEEAAGA